MFKTINEQEFIQAFQDMGRGDQFSHMALRGLYNYFIDLEAQDPDNQIELDVIAICCDFTEYNNVKEVIEAYDSNKIKTLEDLENATIVLPLHNGSLVVQDF